MPGSAPSSAAAAPIARPATHEVAARAIRVYVCVEHVPRAMRYLGGPAWHIAELEVPDTCAGCAHDWSAGTGR